MTAAVRPAPTRSPVSLPGRPQLTAVGDGWFERTGLLTPAMCGPNSLFIGQLGDWTWDAVAAACGLNTYRAVDVDGDPAYLSFAYFRVVARTGLTVEKLSFGERLRVHSKVLSCAGDATLTLHQVRLDGAADHPAELGRFFDYDIPQCIHVENFNRWISRSRHGTNHGLRRATPRGFSTSGLPRVPAEHSPRLVYSQVRAAGTFRSAHEPEPATRLALRYRVDPSRDLNGAGLLYFATYFSIIDWAVLSMWRHLGRSAADFLRRRVTDRQLCYLGNADADDTLRLEVTFHRAEDGDVVDVTMSRESGELVAIARQRIVSEEES